MTPRLRAPDDHELDAAWEVVSSTLDPTPLLATDLPTPFGDLPSWLKIETLQPTGAFKVRGALAALRTLPPGSRAVSASAGNHALGMAWASNETGVPVTVVTPENASAAKVAVLEAMTRRPGSQVTLTQHGLSYEEAETYARGLTATNPDATYVSAYSDYAVIAGQATIGRELDKTFPPDEPLTVVTPLGGGGLASGLTRWAEPRADTHIVAVEAERSRAASTAAAAGRVVAVQVDDTMADGLAGNLEQGSPTPTVLGQAAADGRVAFRAVSEEELGAAIRWLFRTHGLVAEGAGAAAVAAVLAGKVSAGDPPPPGHLVVLVTGRNITAERYAQVLEAAPRL